MRHVKSQDIEACGVRGRYAVVILRGEAHLGKSTGHTLRSRPPCDARTRSNCQHVLQNGVGALDQLSSVNQFRDSRPAPPRSSPETRCERIHC